MKLASTNPGENYEELGFVIVSSEDDVREAAEQARAAYSSWKALSVEERASLLTPFYELCVEHKEQIAKQMSQEMGKPISESLGSVDWGLDYLQHYFSQAAEYLQEEITKETSEEKHVIMYEPYGVVASISPWNFPFSSFIEQVIPALLIGNTVVHKHSEECPLTAQYIANLFLKLDIPQGVFCELYGDGTVGQLLVEQDVDFISFTGSTQVGKKLYELAGKKFVETLLELGGSNPCIVFPSADIVQAAKTIVDRRFMNCGQMCDAIKRVLVHETIHDELVEELQKEMQKLIVGKPSSEETTIGPLVAKRQLVTLQKQVEDAKQKEVTVVVGGKQPENLQGAYYEPTLLTNVTKKMRVWSEEVFGPVLPVMTFSTEEEAVQLANDTPYGLGARICSTDADQLSRVQKHLQAGTVEINSANRWTPENPFGGYKASGKGRGYGKLGFHQLCQVKVVSLQK